jgi:virginiamycin B lyase
MRAPTVALVALLTAGCSAAPAATTPASITVSPHIPTAEPSPSSMPEPPSTDLGSAAWSTKAAGGGVWIQVDPPVDQLVKVDTATGEPTVTIDQGRGIGTDGTEVWVALGPGGLAKIDPGTGETLLAVSVPGEASYAALGAGSVWSTHGRDIGRWDTTTGELLAIIEVDGSEVTELLFAHDALWLTVKDDGVVVRVDPSTNEVVATIRTGAGAHGMAADENGLWVTNYRANTVSRIDPATNEVVATISGVGSGVGIAAGEGAIWVSTQREGIARIDPATDASQPVVDLPFEWNYGLAYDNGALWVSSVDRGLVYRIELVALDG